MPTLIVLSVVIAIFSYFAVERPFRRNATARQVCCSTAAFAMFTLIVAAWGDNIIDTDKTRAPAYQWALNAASPELLELIERKNTRMKCANVASGFGFNYCEIGIQKPNPDFVLWGDSLAGALLHGLNIAAKQREISGIAFVANGCPPVIGLQNTMAKDCTGDTHKEIFKRILEFPELKLVFLTGNFSGAMSAGNVRIYGQPTSTDSVIEQVSSTLQELRSLGTTTVIVEQGPLFSEPVAENILLSLRDSNSEVPVVVREEHIESLVHSRTLSLHTDIYVSTEEFFCNDNICPGVSNYGDIIIYDRNHVTKPYSERLAQFIFENIQSSELNH